MTSTVSASAEARLESLLKPYRDLSNAHMESIWTEFAAEHPEVLSYVPCYCGCERSGHRGNEDCFVTARDTNGDVTQWEPHGMT